MSLIIASVVLQFCLTLTLTQAPWFPTVVEHMVYCPVLDDFHRPCCHHLNALATYIQLWNHAGRWGHDLAAFQPPALGMEPHCCLSVTLSITLHFLSDILLELFILICRTNMVVRPYIRHWSRSWFLAHPSGDQLPVLPHCFAHKRRCWSF